MPCMNKTSRFWCAQPVDATCHSRDLSHQKHAVSLYAAGSRECRDQIHIGRLLCGRSARKFRSLEQQGRGVATISSIFRSKTQKDSLVLGILRPKDVEAEATESGDYRCLWLDCKFGLEPDASDGSFVCG